MRTNDRRLFACMAHLLNALADISRQFTRSMPGHRYVAAANSWQAFSMPGTLDLLLLLHGAVIVRACQGLAVTRLA